MNESEPSTHSRTATSRFADGRMKPGFLASKPRHTRNRCGAGCAFWSASAAAFVPMKPRQSSRPLAMMGDIISRPEPLTTLTTPGGKHA